MKKKDLIASFWGVYIFIYIYNELLINNKQVIHYLPLVFKTILFWIFVGSSLANIAAPCNFSLILKNSQIAFSTVLGRKRTDCHLCFIPRRTALRGIVSL